MVTTILVFFDCSAVARKAFDLGIEMAANFQAKMLIIGVMSAIEAEAMLDRGQDLIGDEFPQLCHEAKAQGISCQYRFDVGDPIKQILRAAKDHDAGLIIIGQAGLTEKRGSAAGSQAERVIRYAPCPVTIIK
jgi:nucleotide-binding universal stress UspA family protein